jgi:hypothetical protein
MMGQPMYGNVSIDGVQQPGVVYQGPTNVSGQPMMIRDNGTQPYGVDPSQTEHRGMLGRLFHRHSDAAMTAAPETMQQVHVSAMPAASPVQHPVVPVAMKLDAAPMDAGSVLVDFPIKPEFRMKVGHDADYRSITGQLYHLYSDGGLWLVRYGSMEGGDRNGGMVLLDSSSDLKDLHEGDLVRVHGHLCPEKQGSMMVNAPVYKADGVDLIQHGE